MLTLDPTTLFYFSLSDAPTKDKHTGLVNDWASKIERPHSKSGSIRSGTTPALSTGSSRSTHRTTSTRPPPSSRSALSNNIKISRDNDVIEISSGDEGGLSDRDETRGKEREFAVKSPPKGRQRATSKVSQLYSSTLHI